MPKDEKPAKSVKEEVPTSNTDVAGSPANKAHTSSGPNNNKNNKTLKIVLIVVGVLIGLGLLGTILVVVFFSALFHEAAKNVDLNNGQVTIKSNEGTTSVGEGAKLADGFPTDVPIFSPSTLVASSKTDDNSFSAVGKTSKSVADVTNYYKSEMAKLGWTTLLDSTSGDGTLLSFQKDNRSAGVVVTNNADDSSNEKTGFVVTVTTSQQ